MTVVQSIEIFTGLNLLVIGLSHTLRPKAWVHFFEFLSSKGEVGNFFNAMISLGMGTIIVAFHWDWNGAMMIVTIYGLLLTLKGSLYLIVPEFGLKSISGKQVKRRNFISIGIIMSLVGAFILIYNLMQLF